MHLANFPSYLTTPLQKISGLKYFLTNVRSWVFKCLSSGLTTHNEQIFLGLPDLTIVENPHAHAHAHLCKSWKQLHYRTCWVQANLCLLAHVQFRSTTDKPMALPSQVHWQMDYWSFNAHHPSLKFEPVLCGYYWFWYILSQGYIRTHFSPIRLGFGYKNIFIIFCRWPACG
jgi:hypothetical protein